MSKIINKTEQTNRLQALLLCLILLFSVHCSKKKSGGLGLGILALAGGEGSSSSSSSGNNATKTVKPTEPDKKVTKCEIKGEAPKTLGINYSLSYQCSLIEEDYGKKLSLQDDKNILEISNKNFSLPQNKDASGSFTVKTKKNQAFSLTIKIGDKSFKRDFPTATKTLEGRQIKIEQFDTTLEGGGNFPDFSSSLLSLVFFKNKFYLFNTENTNYYSSSDGKKWKNEGKPHTNYSVDKVFDDEPMTAIYKDKLYLYSRSKIYSVTNPDGTNFQDLGAPNITFDRYRSLLVLQDKLWLRNKEKLYFSTNGITWTNTSTDNVKKISQFATIVKDGKIWTFGGVDDGSASIKKVYSFSANGNNLKEESELPIILKNASVQIFASGFLVMGGIAVRGSSNILYYSTDGKTWSDIKTDNRFADIISDNFTILKKENEIWGVRTTNPLKILKITFTE